MTQASYQTYRRSRNIVGISPFCAAFKLNMATDCIGFQRLRRHTSNKGLRMTHIRCYFGTTEGEIMNGQNNTVSKKDHQSAGHADRNEMGSAGGKLETLP